jgi:hypothetical protein
VDRYFSFSRLDSFRFSSFGRRRLIARIIRHSNDLHFSFFFEILPTMPELRWGGCRADLAGSKRKPLPSKQKLCPAHRVLER